MASTESQKAQQNLIQATNDLIRTARGGKSDEKVEKIITLLTITKKIKTIEGSSANIHISTDLLKCLRLMLVDNDKSIRVQSCRGLFALHIPITRIHEDRLFSLLNSNAVYHMQSFHTPNHGLSEYSHFHDDLS